MHNDTKYMALKNNTNFTILKFGETKLLNGNILQLFLLRLFTNKN